MTESPLSPEAATRSRYASAARRPEAELCCPVSYDPALLKAIPSEVIERDYGCGDPSRHLIPGDTVLDLGSGTGKICFIASQIVGAQGRVIGVDMTDDMLEVARRNAPLVAKAVGHANVEFRKGRIQDLSLDLEAFDAALREAPVADVASFFQAEEMAERLRKQRPLVASESVDVVVSNCVLNLVDSNHKSKLFQEMFRVLKKGGRAVISDIVADEEVPDELRADPEMWSGCISGAFTEIGFLEAFAEAGFYGIEVLDRDEQPWRTIRGIEFRGVTVRAWKGKEGPCLERNQAVIYKGPFRRVEDDDGHEMERGKRYAVCDKTFTLYGREPYAEHFLMIEPALPIPLEEATPFDCVGIRIRSPRETKGDDVPDSGDCRDGSYCC